MSEEKSFLLGLITGITITFIFYKITQEEEPIWVIRKKLKPEYTYAD